LSGSLGNTSEVKQLSGDRDDYVQSYNWSEFGCVYYALKLDLIEGKVVWINRGNSDLST